MDNQCKFTDLVEDQDILKALDKYNFKIATPVQAESITPMTQGLDVTVQAPTGTGKTLAFGIPLLTNVDISDKTIQALVLSPTRELAIQISKVIENLSTFKRGIRVATIYGGDPIERQFALLRKKPQIVVATPGRLMDHMNRKSINLGSLRTLVLDEADRMLDMGFRPDLNRILSDVPQLRQTALFSATISKDIRDIAKSYQKNPVIIKIKQAALTVDSVEQHYTVVGRKLKNDELVALFHEKHPIRSLVFVNTIRMTENVVRFLKKEGYNTAFLHGDMRQGQRNRVMSQFKNSKIDVLVATDVAARGIDVADIDMVVNYDLPNEEESYVHRIGRTGRADRTGVAYTFIYKKEMAAIRQLMDNTGAKITRATSITQPDAETDEDVQTTSSDRKNSRGGSGDGRRRPRPAGNNRRKPGRSAASGDSKSRARRSSPKDTEKSGGRQFDKDSSKVSGKRRSKPSGSRPKPSSASDR